MPTKKARLTRRVFTGALVATTLGLFGATGMLYVAQSEQRQLLAVSVRTSGWVAYQAQLEYAKALAAIDTARANPSRQMLDYLALRLELLASRLPVFYGSEEGETLAGTQGLAPLFRTYEAQIESYLALLEKLPASETRTATTLDAWRNDLAPLGRDLQQVLETSVAHNEEVYRRERELARNPATLPLALMLVFGAGLVSLLGIQAGRDRRQLNDILAARKAEAATKSNFRAAIEAIPAAVMIFDPATDRVSFVNPAAASLIDPSPSHPDWRRLTRAAQEASKATQLQGARSVTLAFSRPGGEIMSLRGTMCSIVWEGQSQQLLALTDISKIRDAELQLMQSAKLATLGEMATAIAHETNQPLAVIKMAVANAQRLLKSGEQGEALAAKLKRIGDQVDRIKRITDQVRRYGRLASQQQEPFGLQDAIGLAIGFVAEQYRAAGIRLQIAHDLPAELAVAGEQTMFEQVIVNILVNARDAFDDFDSRNVVPTVIVHSTADGDSAVITVEDNAGGVQPDILDRIFEPFATTKAVGKGTGLGLSMSRSIVRDMGGEIEAANIDEGARFTIRLPIASQAANAREAA